MVAAQQIDATLDALGPAQEAAEALAAEARAALAAQGLPEAAIRCPVTASLSVGNIVANRMKKAENMRRAQPCDPAAPASWMRTGSPGRARMMPC